jgi:hypothetical protein
MPWYIKIPADLELDELGIACSPYASGMASSINMTGMSSRIGYR